MHDPQRGAVYLMEAREFRGAWYKVKQPMKYLRRIAAKLCKMYNVPPIKLGSVRKLRGAGAEYYDGSHHVDISEQGSNRNVFTLAHELAHHIVCVRYGRRAQDHGPLFVLIYGQLLSSLRFVPFAGWKSACRRHGVKIARWRNIA